MFFSLRYLFLSLSQVIFLFLFSLLLSLLIFHLFLKLNKKQTENLVVADMGAVIQQCSSSDFQNTDQTKARLPMRKSFFFLFTFFLFTSTEAPVEGNAPSAPEFIRHLQDEVKNQLCRDFQEYGINLVRLNIETPKV